MSSANTLDKGCFHFCLELQTLAGRVEHVLLLCLETPRKAGRRPFPLHPVDSREIICLEIRSRRLQMRIIKAVPKDIDNRMRIKGNKAPNHFSSCQIVRDVPEKLPKYENSKGVSNLYSVSILIQTNPDI